MTFKEWWKGRKEEPKKVIDLMEKKEEKKGKMGFQGKPFHANLPTPMLLERKERRLETVNQLVREKFRHGHPRYKEFMRIKNKLAMEIKLLKGDY